MRSFHSILINLTEKYPKYPWFLNCNKPMTPESTGLWVWFPTGHTTEYYLLAFVMKKLTEFPISWITMGEKFWLVNVDQARLQFEAAIHKHTYGNAAWPDWLAGTIEVEPKYESGPGFTSRMSLRITRDTYNLAARRRMEEARSNATVVQQFYSGVHMETKYTVTGGQVGAMGDNSRAEGNVFNQAWNQAGQDLDLAVLMTELKTLRSALRQNAIEPEQDQAVASVGAAEVAAKSQDRIAVLKNLKAAGGWAFDIATKIGTSVAAKAIQNALGLP